MLFNSTKVCSETKIGSDMVRGVSGGQKKRVTTGEMMVGPAKASQTDVIANYCPYDSMVY